MRPQGGNFRQGISTHALREEGDIILEADAGVAALFLPTPSARRATTQAYAVLSKGTISTHALREEGDPSGFRSAYWPRYF